MIPNDLRHVRNTAVTILALVALRLGAAAWTPLTFDEAYYWMWSKHLAGGYYDHPPGVAAVIRLGTMIAGDTELGVRLVSILLALPMSWAVYRTAAILFGGVRVAATATMLLNVTLMAAVGTLIVTPDAPCWWPQALFCFVWRSTGDRARRVVARGRRRGRRSVIVKIHRAAFRTGDFDLAGERSKAAALADLAWPYLGAAVSLAIFSPVIFWNADHHWVSFIKQLGRARVEDFKPAFIAELIRLRSRSRRLWCSPSA
jgi:hypothetical protein